MLAAALGAETKPSAAELERTEKLIQSLTEMKGRVQSLQNELDGLLQALSEQRGALANPPKFDALQNAGAADSGEAKRVRVRCVATASSSHKRCTRLAEEGSRYCWQHQVAHQR